MEDALKKLEGTLETVKFNLKRDDPSTIGALTDEIRAQLNVIREAIGKIDELLSKHDEIASKSAGSMLDIAAMWGK